MLGSLKEKLRLVMDYLRFRMDAHSRYSIHSPFLFELVNDVFRDQRHYYAFDEIKKIRFQLQGNKTKPFESDFGEKSKSLDVEKKTIGEIARVTALPDDYGKMMFRLVSHLKPDNMLELGTGTGISSLYLAAAAAASPFITIEGSPVLSDIAEANFKVMKLNNILLLPGKFHEILPQAITRLEKLHFVFIDGDHKKQSLLQYMKIIKPHLAKNATVVIDDIYWSPDMKEAWHECIHLPEVTLSVDMYRLGILFFRKGITKQHLKVVV